MTEETCPICPLCQENVGFPVSLQTWLFPTSCKCRQPPMCLTCVRDMLQMNHRGGTVYTNCIICRQRLLIAADSPTRGHRANEIYKKDYDMAHKLDTSFGNIKCHRCNKWEGTRIDWEGTHLLVCPEAVNRCSFPGCTYVGKNIESHLETCRFAERKCEYCAAVVPSIVFHGRTIPADEILVQHVASCLPAHVAKFTILVERFTKERDALLGIIPLLNELATKLFSDDVARGYINLPTFVDRFRKFDPMERVDMKNIRSLQFAHQRVTRETIYCETLLSKLRELFFNM